MNCSCLRRRRVSHVQAYTAPFVTIHLGLSDDIIFPHPMRYPTSCGGCCGEGLTSPSCQSFKRDSYTGKPQLSIFLTLLVHLKMSLSLPGSLQRRVSVPTHWAVNMSTSTGPRQCESDKYVECIHSKLTPCFRLSLAWSATADTITKAAATQTDRKRERIMRNQNLMKTHSVTVTQQLGPDTW